MEGTIVKTVLDDLCVKMDMNSWTIHKNKTGTVVTLRFKESAGKMDSDHSDMTNQADYATYRRKSQYQINRDNVRNRLHQYRYEPRDFDSEQIEKPRNSTFSETSPVNVLEVSQTNDHEFHMDDDGDRSSLCLSSLVQTPDVRNTPDQHIPPEVKHPDVTEETEQSTPEVKHPDITEESEQPPPETLVQQFDMSADTIDESVDGAVAGLT